MSAKSGSFSVEKCEREENLGKTFGKVQELFVLQFWSSTSLMLAENGDLKAEQAGFIILG